MAALNLGRTAEGREERRVSTSEAERSGSPATYSRPEGPLSRRQRGAGNQAVQAAARAKPGPEPTAGLCTRCTRRYRAGKPLDCPDCERSLAKSAELGGEEARQHRSALGGDPRRRDEEGRSLRRRSAAMETECDVRIHPKDMSQYFAGNAFRTLGTGTPQIEERMPGVLEKNPCLGKALRAHEQVHVKNMAGPCSKFKECVDSHSGSAWYTFGLGAEKISKSDWISCRNTYAKNLPDCQVDENEAYEKSIAVAKRMVKKETCAGEKSLLQRNIAHWQSIKNCAPNCPTCAAGGSPLISPVSLRPPEE